MLILVQNATVPLDQRVWPEAQALAARGYEVHVICPRGNGYTLRRDNIRGIRICRYSPGPEGRGVIGYLPEYAIAILSQLFLTLVIRARRRIDVVHICNPPDLLFLVAAPLTGFGVPLVYDHHDACPELMMAKGFGAGSWPVRLNMLRLIDDPQTCDRLGSIGFQRVTTGLSWDAQVPSLLAAYERALLKRREAGTANRKPN